MSPRDDRHQAFRDALRERILLIDGAIGTMIQREKLDEAGYRGELLREHGKPIQGLGDVLCLTRPELVSRVHQGYLEVGAEALTTNTFTATSVSLADYGLRHLAYEINRAGASLAREAADRAGREVFVLGSMGPTNRTLSISPDVSDPAYRAIGYDELRTSYVEQAKGLLAGGADLLLVETCFDTLNAKAAIDAAREAIEEAPGQAGLIVSFTAVDMSGRNLTGQTAEAFWISVRHADATAAGINCSLGAAAMRPFLRDLAREASVPVTVVPNCGLPNELGEYDQTPEEMAEELRQLAVDGLVNAVGGCCGTQPPHIRAIGEAISGLAPRPVPRRTPRLRLAGSEPLVRPEQSFLVIGERTNVTGSRKFANLVREERLEEALAVARDQVASGANLLDVNMDDALLDSRAVMERFLRLVAMEPDVTRLPMMLDSSRLSVLEAGLRAVAGKCVVNSLSLKDGPEAFLDAARRVRRFGAAVVVMAFDEQGQAVDRERKTEICTRAVRLLTEEAGFPPEDIILDPNVLAVATGIPEHDRYALEFLEALPSIREACPGALISGGVSNVSFAFRGNEAVRQAMNSVFLHHAIRAGLDMAIVNAGRLPLYDDIPESLRERVEDVLLARREDATERLVEVASEARVRSRGQRADTSWRELPVGERLAHAVLHGVLDHVDQDTRDALADYEKPLAVIEGPLMDGMRIVGDRFGAGRMFLPQVVKSARVMKRAVAILEPWMEQERKAEEGKAGNGPIVLATVKGDVHDIGKSIVGIVLACNGHQIVDLGVMVPSERILDAARKNGASLIGLSGLITPSLDEMERFASEMERRGVHLPLLIGGATTSARHTALRIAPRREAPVVHVADASRASGVVSALLGEERSTFVETTRREQQAAREEGSRSRPRLLSLAEARARAPRFERARSVRPEFLGVRSREAIPISELFPYIDWTPFFHAWQFRGVFPALLEDPDAGPAAQELHENARRRLRRLAEEGSLEGFSVHGLFPATAAGDDIEIRDPEDPARIVCRLATLRQQTDRDGPRLAVADFLDGSETDTLGLFAVNAGKGLDELVAKAEAKGDDYDALLLRSLGDRLAEALAERTHLEARRAMGYGREEALTPEELLREKYQGIRPAPGYPATPDLGILREIFDLLSAESRIGVRLTDNFAIHPAASVAGLYFGSPEARYFSVGRIGRDQLADYAARRGICIERAESLLKRLLV